MNAAWWFIAGWISAGVVIFVGQLAHLHWQRRRDHAANVYTQAELERAVQRREGLR